MTPQAAQSTMEGQAILAPSTIGKIDTSATPTKDNFQGVKGEPRILAFQFHMARGTGNCTGGLTFS